MTNKLNNATPPDIQTDLVTKAARFGAIGWIAFAVTLIVLILQNLIMAIMPTPMAATHDGKVVGQVIFDEARIRSEEMIIADLKTWAQHCTSVNKNTIYEDLSVCLNHMAPELSNQRLAEYQEANYIVNIANVGCERTQIQFDDESIWVEKAALDTYVKAQITGDVICPQPQGRPVSQGFSIKIVGQLVPRDSNFPLGVSVIEYEDAQ